PRARRASAAARAPPLLLEERQVGPRLEPDARRRARLLGDLRLSRSRRPVARAALPGRLGAADGSTVAFEAPLAAPGCVLVASRSAATRRRLRPCPASTSDASRCDRTHADDP